jgi:GGDEF domain-containing protein
MALAMRHLDWVDWLSVIGSIITIATLLWFLAGLVVRLRRASFTQAAQEFDLLARRPGHVILLSIVVVTSAFLVAFPPSIFPLSLLTLIPVTACLLLLLSFFLAQNPRLIRNLLLNEIRKAITLANKRRNQPCSAIRFDVDLIVAINDYSFAVGTQIIDLVRDTIYEASRRLKREGVDVTVVSVPESDETILILPGMSGDRAADVADEVRRHVKASLPRIPYYAEAREYVIRALQNPSLTDEEKEGIGTVSAGVAAYSRGEEALLSDISTAVKESKFRGRNKTIIHNHGSQSAIRSDYVS